MTLRENTVQRTAGLITLSVALSLVATALVTVILRIVAYRRMVSAEVRSLFARRDAGAPRLISTNDLVGLPDPVQRWLKAAGVVGTRIPSAVRLKQRGGIRTSPSARYMPFTATQYYTTEPPGFVWAAWVWAAPLVFLTGRDKYENGAGKMDIRLMATVPVVDASGPELNQGTMLRYLNEIMWFPAAALSPAIFWQPIDDRHARATLTDRDASVSAVFTFDDRDRVETMEADRYLEQGGSFTLQRWTTPVTAYGEFNGIAVPVEGEGVWQLDKGPFSYIHLGITGIEYDIAAEYPGGGL